MSKFDKLPKPGTYKAYLAAWNPNSGLALTKAEWMKQKKQAAKSAKAAEKAENQALIAAAQAAGAQAGQSLAAGVLPGESGGVPTSTPFAGGADVKSTLAKVAVIALPAGLVILGVWWYLKRRRKKK